MSSRSPRPRLAALLAGALALTGAVVVPAARGAGGDPEQSRQWALDIVGAPAAWAGSTGVGVPIGIVDTGVDLGHEDLAGKVVAHTSCVGSGGVASGCGGSGQDDHGHGTHVAGIAVAWRDNGKGVAGVAPGASLVVAKAFDKDGSGRLEDIIAGIEWVVDHGAKVVNLSLADVNFIGSSLFGSGLDEGIDYAWSHGAIPVLASGNVQFLGLGSSNYGDLDTVVVGATGRNDRMTGYSSPPGSAKWAILAPGGSKNGNPVDDIYSTFWEAGKANQYGPMAGTSMAVPHVSGALALLLARGLSPSSAIQLLLESANHSVSCGGGSPNCVGRLDVGKAMAALPPPTTTPSTTPTTTPTTAPASTSTTTTTPTTVPSVDSDSDSDPIPPPAPAAGGPLPGYLVADRDGRVRAFGSALFQGQVTGTLNRPIVTMAAVPGSAHGYWLAATDGGIFSFGEAKFHGSTGHMKLNQPIVSMAPTRSGHGYWLVAADGGIFSFGDAKFRGSTGDLKLNRPIVGMARTASGKGYWLVASDGGIFAFGDARFHGSTGAMRLNRPIVGMASTPTGDGYWLVASDGGIFAFGDARFHGSTGAIKLNQPIVGMTSTQSGAGYWFVAADGGVFNFGDARFLGSAATAGLSKVIGLAREAS